MLLSSGIDETFMDGVAQRHQQVPGFSGLPDSHELARPFTDLIMWISVMALDGSFQIQHFVWII
ncbi:hypothetical protein D3C80_1823230 [compost metagenome]